MAGCKVLKVAVWSNRRGGGWFLPTSSLGRVSQVLDPLTPSEDRSYAPALVGSKCSNERRAYGARVAVAIMVREVAA